MLKLMIKHFFSSFYFKKFVLLHLILLITFSRVKSLMLCLSVNKSFPVKYILYIFLKIYFQVELVDTYLHAL